MFFNMFLYVFHVPIRQIQQIHVRHRPTPRAAPQAPQAPHVAPHSIDIDKDGVICFHIRNPSGVPWNYRDASPPLHVHVHRGHHSCPVVVCACQHDKHDKHDQQSTWLASMFSATFSTCSRGIGRIPCGSFEIYWMTADCRRLWQQGGAATSLSVLISSDRWNACSVGLSRESQRPDSLTRQTTPKSETKWHEMTWHQPSKIAKICVCLCVCAGVFVSSFLNDSKCF